ncbi:MAG: serine/threonine-protein kinase [Caldilineaceae bacterium]
MATLVPGSRLGAFPYQIVKVLDENPGNMSEVCLATVRDAGSGQESQVVIKLSLGNQEEYRDAYQKTLENEVECLRQLKHPGIVRIFPIQRDGLPNLPYIAQATAVADDPLFSVLEFLGGGSLTNLIATRGLNIGMALEIARSIAATLDYLHSRRQVHMDLKPDNVLFRTPPMPGEPVEPVLIDFGISRAIGQSDPQAFTLQYAAPERVQATRQPNQPPELAARPHPAMDVYALGVVLYEMLTNQPPFQGRSKKSLTSAILSETPKLPSSYNRAVNGELDQFVLKMLAKEPQVRPTAEEVAIHLEVLAIKGGYQPRYPNRVGDPARPVLVNTPPRARRWAHLAAVLLFLLVLQFLFIWGTYPYWQAQVAFTGEGLLKLLQNIYTYRPSWFDLQFPNLRWFSTAYSVQVTLCLAPLLPAWHPLFSHQRGSEE